MICFLSKGTGYKSTRDEQEDGDAETELEEDVYGPGPGWGHALGGARFCPGPRRRFPGVGQSGHPGYLAGPGSGISELSQLSQLPELSPGRGQYLPGSPGTPRFSGRPGSAAQHPFQSPGKPITLPAAPSSLPPGGGGDSFLAGGPEQDAIPGKPCSAKAVLPRGQNRSPAGVRLGVARPRRSSRTGDAIRARLISSPQHVFLLGLTGAAVRGGARGGGAGAA